tara:strand:+ start:429 stop:1106 length:678 start_codon:yes stop_codon:yes gene_type:complete
MSSSSSLSGARRRRAGGGSGPTSSGQPQQRPTNPSTQPQTDPQQVNPFMLLQQHNMKINMIEQTVREFMVNRELNMKNDNNTNTNNNSIDVEEIGNSVLNKIESQLDLKSFYENDNKLMEEITGLKKLVDSQQIIINNLNTTMCGLVQKLDLNTSKVTSISPVIENTTQPTFPSRMQKNTSEDITSDFMPINEDKFNPMTTDEDNFQPLTTDEDNNVSMDIGPLD